VYNCCVKDGIKHFIDYRRNSSFPNTKEDPGKYGNMKNLNKNTRSDSCYSRVCKSLCWAWDPRANWNKNL